MNIRVAMGLSALLVGAAGASADIRITEYMYQGNNAGADALAEFFEITNFGAAAVNMAAWSIDDNSQTPGSQSLASLGMLAPGESAVVTEMTDAAFRARWGLGAAVKILAGNTQNLGRGDEINLYDGTTLIDRLTFDDQAGKGFRTRAASGWRYRSLGGGPYGDADSTWALSTVGDAQNSWKAISPANADDIGSPGSYVVPAPGALGLLGLGALIAGRRRAR